MSRDGTKAGGAATPLDLPKTTMAIRPTTPRTEIVSTDGRIKTDRVNGGILVYVHDDGPGRRLAGFADVSDWDAIRSELARRGHGVGAMHHLEEYELAELAGVA